MLIIDRKKHQDSLTITGQMAAGYLACIGKNLGHMVRPMDLMSNCYAIFLDYRLWILSTLSPEEKIRTSFHNYCKNLLRPEIQRALGNA